MDPFTQKCQSILARTGIGRDSNRAVLQPDTLSLFKKAFTAKEVDPRTNYELLEAIGDKTANKCILWYLIRRFPQLCCNDAKEILAKLKMQYIQTDAFSRFIDKLDLFQFIRMPPDHLMKKPVEKYKEDVFEAIIAVIELSANRYIKDGMGCALCYHFIESLMDEEEISLRHNDIIDPISRLKELTESYPKTNRIIGHQNQCRVVKERVSRVSSVDPSRDNVIWNGKEVGSVGKNDQGVLLGMYQVYDKQSIVLDPVFPGDALIGVSIGISCKDDPDAKQESAENALIHLKRYHNITEVVRPIFRELGS